MIYIFDDFSNFKLNDAINVHYDVILIMTNVLDKF